MHARYAVDSPNKGVFFNFPPWVVLKQGHLGFHGLKDQFKTVSEADFERFPGLTPVTGETFITPFFTILTTSLG